MAFTFKGTCFYKAMSTPPPFSFPSLFVFIRHNYFTTDYSTHVKPNCEYPISTAKIVAVPNSTYVAYSTYMMLSPDPKLTTKSRSSSKSMITIVAQGNDDGDSHSGRSRQSPIKLTALIDTMLLIGSS
jgi:hypothetical protein